MIRVQIVVLALLMVASVGTLSACTRAHVGQSAVREEPHEERQVDETDDYRRGAPGEEMMPERQTETERQYSE